MSFDSRCETSPDSRAFGPFASVLPFSTRAFFRSALFFLLFAILATAARATVTATRPGLSSNGYTVGQTAVLTVSTSPVQANQPVYRFRKKNGFNDGAQPTFIGNTNSNGTLTNSYVLQATDVGSYTGEKFAVGSPAGPTSSVRNFDVHATSRPTAIRFSPPFPNYQVGDLARLEVHTNPAQPFQAVYRYRYKNGSYDGAQPTSIGTTDMYGVLVVEGTLTTNEIGEYAAERFSVGTPSGPQSYNKTYSVHADTPPMVTASGNYPSYQIGDSATFTITTEPRQRYQKVYRTFTVDGITTQSQYVGTTNSSGKLYRYLDFDAGDVGTYTGETYTVGTTGGPASVSLDYVVTPPLPVVDSIAPDLVLHGSVTDLVLTGQNLDGTSVSVEGTGILPSVTVIGGSADGTSLDVQVDASAPGVSGFFTLVIDNGSGTDRAAFEIAPLGPDIYGFTPSKPEQGKVYALMIFGQNLGGATITSSDPTNIRVLATSESGGPIGTTFDNPPGSDVSNEGSIQALLQIKPGTPLGAAQLLVRDPSGGITPLDIEVRPAGGAATAGFGQHSLKDLAVAKAGSAAAGLPEILVQDFDLGKDPVFGKIGGFEPISDCNGTATWRYFRHEAASYPLDEFGQALTIASMALGEPRNFDVATFSAYLNAQVRLYWGCEREEDNGRIDWYIHMGFDLVGLVSAEFMVRPDNGRILFAGDIETYWDQLDFTNLTSNCVDSEPYPNLFSNPGMTVTQTSCCPGEVEVDFTAPVHPRSPFAAGLLVARDLLLLETDPSENEACELPALQVEEVSFFSDHPIYNDTSGQAPLITDPVWQASGESNSNDDSVIAYTQGTFMDVRAKFSVTPNSGLPPQFWVRGEASVDDGLLFEDYEASVIPGPEEDQVVITATSHTTIAPGTAYYPNMTIDWSYSTDGENFLSAGHSQHEMFVTLRDPDPTIPKVFRSALKLAIGNGGAYSDEQAATSTWGRFALGSGFPANVRTWEGVPLRYYPTGFGFPACYPTSEQLLTLGGSGQCGGFAQLFDEALGINGYPYSVIGEVCVVGQNATPPIDCTPGSPDTAGIDMIIGNFDFLGSGTSGNANYPWKLDLVQEAGGLCGMFPAASTTFGELRSTSGHAGQNSSTPSEKVFSRHQIVLVFLGGQWKLYDPSYGRVYNNLGDFEQQAIVGYSKHRAEGTACQMEARKPPLLSTVGLAIARDPQ